MTDYSKKIASFSPEKRALLELRLKKQGSNYNTFPMSFSQQRLWFLEQLEPGNSIYNLSSAVRMTGSLHVEVLSKSLQEIVRRHEILRTTFQNVNGEAMQIVAPDSKIELPLIDLQDASPDEREGIIRALAAEETQLPFDLTRGPLFRAKLLRLDQKEHIVLFTMHHIISDGWSIGVLNREIAILYDALINGKPIKLPQLTVQYADYAQWQRKWLTGQVMESLLSYWKKQLGDNLPVLELPTDYPRPAIQTYNGRDESFAFSKSFTDKLNQLSRDNNATLFMTLLAAFQTLLYRYSGQDDICVGTPIANRTRAEAEGLIGFFVNTLVLRTHLSGNPSFRELLSRVREVTLGAYAHQELPFEKLVEVLQPERDMSHTPLFQVMFILQNTPIQPIKLRSLTVAPVQVESKTAEFDLTLSMTETPDGLIGALQYNRDLFESGTIRRMIQHFQNLLEAIVTNPEARILDLPLISPIEQRRIIVDWNETQTAFPVGRCIHRLIEDQVARTPDAIAVVTGEKRLSYQELNHRANQLAIYLQSIGVGPEKLVGICIDRSLEMIVGLLGILKAGGAYVPLDPNYPQERLEYIITDSNVSVLITQSQYVSRLPKLDAQIICLDTDWAKIISQHRGQRAELVGSHNLAYIIYTSGSTGTPKGVLISHESVINHNTEVINKFRLRSDDRILQFATINFDAAVEEIFPALMCGATLVLRPGGSLISGMELLQFVEQEKLTVLDLPTVYWHEWVHEMAVLKRKLPSSLRLVIIGGDKASRERLSLWQEIVEGNVSLINTYGPTETTVISTLAEIEEVNVSRQKLPVLPIGRPIANTRIYLLDANLQPVPVGVPGELCIGGVGLARGYLNRPDLTAEKFIPNPFARLPGERLYRTGDLARYLPDGNIDFIGRVDNQVKIRGFRVELNEVETVLEKHPLLHEVVTIAEDIENRPGEKRLVAYCVPVFSRSLMKDDKRRHVRVPFFNEALIGLNGSKPIKSATEDLSHGGARLMTISPMPNYDQIQRVSMALNLPVVPEQVEIESDIIWQCENHVGLAFRNLTPDHQKILDETILGIIEDQNMLVKELRQFAHQNLPEYMVPQVFVILDEIPKTPSGKVDRRALPKPDLARPELEGAYVAPRNAIEEMLAGMWAVIFGLKQVGVYDNFFELGGHSLLATQFISRMRDVFQVELPLRVIFETPTIAGLAEKIAAIRNKVDTPMPPIRPIPRAGNMPLSFGQQRLWFLDQLEPNSPMYNIPDAFLLAGELDINALKKSIDRIIERHEVLRTTFEMIDGQPVQIYHQKVTFPLPVVDLSHLPEDQRTIEARKLAAKEHGQPFNLAQWPLFRVLLLRLSAKEHVVLLTMHHIISDGWSTGVLMKEVTQFYEGFVTGKAIELPELAIQYADYAFWQRQFLQGEILEKQLNYWKKQLAGSALLLELPTDHPRPAIQTYRGAVKIFSLPDQVTTKIKQLSNEQGSTLFITLLAAFNVLLHKYSHQEDINVGTPVANRTHSEVEPLIGFFVNTLVLRTDLSGDPSFIELVKRVKEVTLGAYAHQDVPFEKLVDVLQPERNLSHTPLFQVMFVLQNADKGAVPVGNLTLKPLEIESHVAKYDLTLFMVSEQDQMRGAFEYSTDLFEQATIDRMIAQFQKLLAEIVATPQKHVSQLSVFEEAEKEKVLKKWNDTRVQLPKGHLVHRLFQQQAAATPEAIAVVYKDEVLTYDQLNRRSNQLAHYLQKLDVGPEKLVGIYMERSLELMIGLLAILKAGGAYVPLDPSHPRQRLSYVLDDSRIDILLTLEHLVATLPANNMKTICLDVDWSMISRENDDDLTSQVNEDNLAYVIYTSGSTGKPKGTLLTHGGLMNYLSWCLRHYPVKEGRGSLVHSPLVFDATITGLYAPLLAGGTVTLLPESHEVETLSGALKQQRNYGVIKITPAHLQLLGYQLQPEEAKDCARAFIIGGENLTSEHIAFWRSHAPATQLINEYGPTETVVGCMNYIVSAGDMFPSGSVPIGYPIQNTQIYILDKNLNPVPIGVSGEIFIGGAGVARGYLNRPDLTAERFIPDPFSDQAGARFYRSGDLARFLPDGNIEFLGRIDDQVKIRGFRIELGEIENTLVQHPNLRETVVVMREDKPGEKQLVAYAVPETDSPPTITELRNFLKAKLPDYMIPAVFVMLEKLPLTSNGKVDRKALPVPDHSRPHLDDAYISPATATEMQLAEIWKEVLNLSKIGIHDNFFELGGDSILTIQVIAKAQKKGLYLTPKQFFQTPTIAGLANYLTYHAAENKIEAEQGGITGQVPLTPIQHWFFEQEFAAPHHYNQSLFFEVKETLDAHLLRQAIGHLYAHHDALRLRFRRQNGNWEQYYAEMMDETPFESHDLSAASAAEQRDLIEEQTHRLQASLDLERGPLIRVALFELGVPKGQRLLIVVHHLAVDGVSWRILLEDLQTIYQQLQSGQPVQLPPKTTSFKYWAEKLAQFARSGQLHAEQSYWQTISNKAVHHLPVDNWLGENLDASEKNITVMLSRDETAELLREVPATYHTQINDILLTALVQAHFRLTGSRSMLVDLEGHGRQDLFDDVDLSRTVGWFTSIFPVVLDLRWARNCGDAVKTIKEQLRQIPQNGIGYGLLRYLSGNQELLDRFKATPAAQISFNYLGQFDQMANESQIFDLAKESKGRERSPQNKRNYMIDIIGSIAGGKLRVEFKYSVNLHRRETIERFASYFLTELQAIIAHCQSPGAGGFTPSDFTLVKLNQKKLDKVIQKLNKKKEKVS